MTPPIASVERTQSKAWVNSTTRRLVVFPLQLVFPASATMTRCHVQPLISPTAAQDLRVKGGKTTKFARDE